jgi:hypothetical protein
MEKDIKDYLHLYLGCECLGNNGKPYTLKPSHFPSNWKEGINGHKPILRPLSDMTEEEKKDYNNRKQRKGHMAQVHAYNTLWLLSKHFDLFGLITDGLAIDKTTLK